MPTPTFPLGLALADNPATSMLMVRLFENVPPAGGFTDINQFVQSTHPDIGSSGPDDWYPADVVDANLVFRKSKKIDFRTRSAVPGKVARGFYVTMLVSGVAHVLHWEAYDNPISLAAVGDNVVHEVNVQAMDIGFITP